MKLDVAIVRKCLKSFDFSSLFREHLGWDKHQAQLDIPVDGDTVRLSAVAQKRGFIAYVCLTIPDRNVRRKVDHQITKTAHEHFVIYADKEAGQQIWQWVRREPGKPIAPRDHRFDVNTTGDALIQRLDQIAVSLDEEESITVVDVAGRARAAFDVDKVTKKFYDRFKAEHAAFLKFIKGIKTQADLEWYTSLMLNRLMFVYFIQKKGFLDGDTNYLQSRMRRVREVKGKDKFQSFYRYFLLRLFHDGLGKLEAERKLDRDLEKLIGKVPYLNGGFFEVHQLEERNTDIDIPDKAFEKLFAFFDEFAWHLDERPLRAGNEINPDVVGYIFEKYINQKQMGAYYTKEDITEYISKNTIIPFLFDAAQKKCPIAFKPDSFLWRLLRDDPDRYIYPAVRHGVIDAAGNVIPLPKDIEGGIKDVAKRGGWNKAAPEPFAQPTETWREHVTRRQRCLELREKLRKGEVHQINDLITLNLDIWQFARDAIVNSEGPELLRAFWHAIAGRVPEKSNEKFESGITVLDPTCGSGAFLFAALRILETLYSDCLQGMASFLEEPDVPPAPEEQVKALIARGENDRCEFKATMRHCVKTAQAAMPEDRRKEALKAKDKDRNHDVLKSVAAMLNTAGGDVVVGVQDDGVIFGLEADYPYFSKESERNRDGYELWLRQLFVNHFGVLNSQKVRAVFLTLEEKQVLWLRILPAESAAYVLGENKQKSLYVRNGNETRALEIEQVVAYHQTRFSPEAIKALPAPTPEPVVKLAKKKRFEDFRSVLAQIAQHPSERYFILKSIIITNLFGVDIMEEAVEICKLRLFLKLVSQVETVDQIEPLPDIDFNIRAGNTLVGYTSLEQIRQSQQGKLGFEAKEIALIEDEVDAVEAIFRMFQRLQTRLGGRVTASDKEELRGRMAKLSEKLNRYLAGEYGIDADRSEKEYLAWKTSHQPFHWLAQFYGIMRNGGFDVIIGNPPYVEWHKVTEYGVLPNAFKTRGCGNLYAAVLEKCFGQSPLGGRIGMIVQLSAICTDRMQALQDAYRTHSASIWASCFDDRPGKLFDGLEHIRASIILSETAVATRAEVLTTNLMRWPTETRGTLFSRLHYGPVTAMSMTGSFPKAAEPQLVSLLNRMWSLPSRLERVYDTTSQNIVYYYRSPLYWIRAMDFLPHFSSETAQRSVHHFKDYPVTDPSMAALVGCLINSTTFYIWFVAYGNGRNVTLRDISTLPVPETLFSPKVAASFVPLFKRLMNDYRKHSIIRTRRDGVEFQEFAPGKSKQFMDDIDRALAPHYGFTPEELDFIINYDIKYRLGQDGGGDDEDE